MSQITTPDTPAALARSLAVFAELGWVGQPAAAAAGLPLGTPEQRRIALAGLRAGAWGAFEATSPQSYGWRSWLGADIDAGVLALFAIRLGVTVRRALAVLPGGERLPEAAVVAAISDRGAAYATEFVTRASTGAGRLWVDATSRFAGITVRLVHRLGLPVPQRLDYLRDWAVYALGAPGNDGWLQPRVRPAIDPAELAPRFAEHAAVAVAAGLSVTGPFGPLMDAARERGWLDKDAARALAFAGLDAAQRPGDRKVWAVLLTDRLGVTGPDRVAELRERADALVSAIATGDAALIEAFGPPLIAHGDEQTVADVLQLGLRARTKKARRALLGAAAARPRPAAAEELAPLVAAIATGADAPLARAARAVLTAWGLDRDTTARDQRPLQLDAPVRGVWLPTPPLWEVPRFDIGEVSAAALTAAAAALSGAPESSVSDPAAERVLALANRVARTDAAAARVALRGVRPQWVPGLRGIAEWVAELPIPMLDRPPRSDIPGSSATVYPPVPARDAAVLQRLGSVPELLSTPSWDDLRVDPADLVARLRAYDAGDASAIEADLLLALLRLDLGALTPEISAELAELRVPVICQDGATLATPAGPAVLRYLADPLREPDRVLDPQRHWWAPGILTLPESLAEFPPRLRTDTVHGGLTLDAWPGGGDTAGWGIEHSELAGLGRDLGVLVTRSVPLTPGLAVNLLGAQRGFHERAVVAGTQAVRDAWARGILIPGMADPARLDWQETPGKLAGFAAACAELADEGLLAVVWPLLDALVARSLRAPRLLAGTAELVTGVGELLPAVRSAVAAGVAPADSLALPGTRALAAAPGNSRAVALARKIAAELPEDAVPAPPGAPAVSAGAAAAATPAGATAPAPMSDAVFEEAWPSRRGAGPAIDDGAAVTARWHDPNASTRFLEIGLAFPAERLADSSHGDRVFRTRTSWFYDLEHEGQCGMTEGLDSPIRHDARAWLRWDPAAAGGTGAVAVAAHRNWRDGADGPLRRDGAVPPLTSGMVAVMLGSMNHDNGHAFTVREAVRSELFGAATVRLAVAGLLGNADYSPVKLAGLIESDPDTLPTLWPALTEPVRIAAATTGTPPRWLNRVLDVALGRAALLRAAADRGHLPADAAAWPGLAELAARSGSQAALRKARALRTELGPAVR